MESRPAGQVLEGEREPEVQSSGRIEDLYRRYAPDAARVAYLLTGDRALAEDLAQEAFVRVMGHYRDLRNRDSFGWYLRRAVINLSNSHFRKLRTERATLARAAREPAGPLRGGEADLESRDEMWRRLQELPERQRTALVLRFYEDLPEAHIAEIMGSPVGTVKSLISRGVARLRGELSRGEEP